MEVKILELMSFETVDKAASIPYQTKNIDGLGKRVFNLGHRSIARHAMAVFEVTDVSQSLLAQLSRHPHINLTVKSSRYCDMSGAGYYIPERNIKKISSSNEEFDKLIDEYDDDMRTIMQIYEKWKGYEGDTKEADVAKMFLPKASYVDLVVSGNYQALYEFIQLRLCVRVESEIRELVRKMANLLAEMVPDIFKGIDCRAQDTGICLEYKSCGKYPKKGK